MLVCDGNDAKSKALSNTEKAVEILYKNRKRKFNSERQLADFIIEIACVVNSGIVKEDKLFRNGKDSTKYCYVRIKDLNKVWLIFIASLFKMLNNNVSETVYIAAYSEYIINAIGHFFSDGCGKISMLISMYIFMRANRPCVHYVNRSQYYEIINNTTIYTPENFSDVLKTEAFDHFLQYYESLCKHAS